MISKQEKVVTTKMMIKEDPVMPNNSATADISI